MRRSTLHLTAAGLAASLLVGCAAGKYYGAAERYRDRNPHAAAEYLALCLREDPSHAEAIALLDEIGKKIAQDHASKITTLEASGKFPDAVAACDRVIAARDFIVKLPGQISIYYEPEQRTDFAKKSATYFYDEGAALKSRENFKDAAVAFRRCMGFQRTFKDAKAQYDECKANATTKLEINDFRANRGEAQGLARRLSQQFGTGIKGKRPEFLEIVSSAGTADLIGTIDADYEDTGWVEDRFENTTTVDEQVGTDELGNPIYEQRNVSASWSVYSRSTRLSLSISYEVKSRRGVSVTADSASGSAQDSYTYRSPYSGDSRAVPFDVSMMTEERREVAGFDALANQITPAAMEKLVNSLYNYYK